MTLLRTTLLSSLLATVVLGASAAPRTEVIPLNYRTADDVMAVAQSVIGSEGCSAARNSSACCAINPTRLVFQWWKRNFRIARRVPPGYPN